MDRRIKRTRSAVFNAVLDLIIEKDAAKITVLELCKKADINKSTFYLHYKSIGDCLQKCFEAIMDGVVEISKIINYEEIRKNPKPLVDNIIDEIIKNQDYLYKFKISNISGKSLKMLKENLVKNIAEQNGFTKDDNYYEVANITFGVAGFIDVVIEMLPNIDKELLSKTICTMIKSYSK